MTDPRPSPDAAIAIPHDQTERERLFNMAGLTDDERHAINQWCFDEEQKRQRGIVFHEGERRA